MMNNESAPTRPDGRRLRSNRTRQAMAEAFLALVRERRQMPTAVEVAERAGYATRSVFERFGDLNELFVAAGDHAMAMGRVTNVPQNVNADRATRIKTQIENRARICEEWMPLWRLAIVQQYTSKELAKQIVYMRQGAIQRLELMYAPELATLPDGKRRELLIALELITDFESWGRMRDEHGLSVEQGCATWMLAVGRMLPLAFPLESATDVVEQTAGTTPGV